METGNPVVVIGRQRSGTTVLRKFLASSCQYIDVNEIFHGDFLQPSGEERSDLYFFAYLSRAVAANKSLLHPSFWPKIFDDFLANLCAVYGSNIIVDIKYNMLNFVLADPNLTGSTNNYHALKALSEKNAMFIHLTRKNVLRSIVSEKIAIATAQWGLLKEAERKEAKIDLDPLTIIDDIDTEIGVINHVRSVLAEKKNVVEFDYSVMFDEDGLFSEAFSEYISKLVGVRGLSREPALLKQNTKKLSELIANYQEISNALVNSRFAWMLDK